MPSSKFQRRWVGVLVWSTLALTGCDDAESIASKAAVPAMPQGIGVVIEPARTMPFAAEIRALGTAFANQSIDVTSKVSNTVVALHFAEGSEVRRGDVLVELDKKQTAAELEIAEAALAETERQYRRSLELFQTKVISQSNLDQIETALKGDRARLAAARARLDDLTIRAPFNGRVGFRAVSIGSLVSPGDAITTLDDISVIKLDFTVPEPVMSYIEPGLPVAAVSVTLPGKTFDGKVDSVGARVDAVTRSITVRALLPNERGELRPGLFMNVHLSGAPRDAVVIPEQALVNERGAVFVFVVGEDQIARRREVQAGGRQLGTVEIVSGLLPGERIVVDGLVKLRDGLPVRAVPPVIHDATTAAAE